MNTHTKPINPWLMAVRLRTFPIPTIQVLTGLGLAYAVTGQLNLLLALYTWLVALFITIGTNLINDVFDIEKGGDTLKRHGQMKVIRLGLLTRDQVFRAGILFFLAAIVCAIPLAMHAGVTILLIVILSTLIGYAYTGGPFPICYIGLSEIFILVFYGFVCVGSAYYIQTLSFDFKVVLCAVQMGFLAILPNALNNFRDLSEDAVINKRTLAVRFGKTFARKEIAFCTAVPFILNLYWIFYGYYFAAFLPLLLLPLAFLFVRSIWTTEPSPIFNRYFGLSILLHCLFGVLLFIGLCFL